jgi:hypothetical protein
MRIILVHCLEGDPHPVPSTDYVTDYEYLIIRIVSSREYSIISIDALTRLRVESSTSEVGAWQRQSLIAHDTCMSGSSCALILDRSIGIRAREFAA